MPEEKADSGAKVSGRFRVIDEDGNVKQEGDILPGTFITANSREELMRKLEEVENFLELLTGAKKK